MKEALFAKTKYFIIDLDGTFYLGDALIDGAVDFVQSLAQKGKDYCFFTNNSANSRALCRERLARMGFDAPAEKILLSTDVVCAHLNEYHKGQSVYVLGNENLTGALLEAGISLTQDKPDVVLLGLDTTLTFDKVARATAYLSDEKVTYLATHPDVRCPTASGFMPDAGSIIAFVEAATGGRLPQVLGKPYVHTVNFLTDTLGCSRDALCFVGDRLETDIAIGVDHGAPAVLVLTGVTDSALVEQSSIRPSLVVERLGDLSQYI